MHDRSQIYVQGMAARENSDRGMDPSVYQRIDLSTSLFPVEELAKDSTFNYVQGMDAQENKDRGMIPRSISDG